MPNSSYNSSSRSRRRNQKKIRDMDIAEGLTMMKLSPSRRGPSKRRSTQASRLPRGINNKEVNLIFNSQAFQLRLNATTLPATGNSYYRSYIRFGPNAQESLVVNPIIDMVNLTAPGVTLLGVFPDGELASWAALYSNVKLISVTAKYTPSVTMGVVSTTAATTLAASTKMVHVPILDNIDDIMTSGAPTVSLAPTTGGFSHIKQRPFVSEASIYKPWTRTFTPRFFELLYSPNIGQTSASGIVEPKASPYMDLLELSGVGAGVDYVDGLLLMSPACSYGGVNPPSTNFPNLLNDIFALGFIEFTYRVHIKSRI